MLGGCSVITDKDCESIASRAYGMIFHTMESCVMILPVTHNLHRRLYAMTTPVDEVLTAASVMIAGHGNKTIAGAPGSLGPPQTKRSRIQLSCTHCRHAKLKCNREKPCAQCIKKGRASLCIFPPSITRKKPAARMQNRLDHLESLVKGVMTSQPPDTAHNDSANNSNTSPSAFILQLQKPIEAPKNIIEPPTSTNNAVSSASGQVLLAPNETTYVGATHWAAMLDDVRFFIFLLICDADQLLLSRLKK